MLQLSDERLAEIRAKADKTMSALGFDPDSWSGMIADLFSHIDYLQGRLNLALDPDSLKIEEGARYSNGAGRVREVVDVGLLVEYKIVAPATDKPDLVYSATPYDFAQWAKGGRVAADQQEAQEAGGGIQTAE